jgi:hypothetical protein
MSEPATEWYWDLDQQLAVPADQRGPGDHTLGPYRTKGEAENWKAKVDTRNDAWDEDDERWNSWGDEPDGDAQRSGP